jgi:hypothetical protein
MKHIAVSRVRNHERFRAENGKYYVELIQLDRKDKLTFAARQEDSRVVAFFDASIIVVLAQRFFDVLPRLLEGKKYRRQGWVANVYISFDAGEKFVTLHGRTAPTRWSPYKDDFDAEDWEEVE